MRGETCRGVVVVGGEGGRVVSRGLTYVNVFPAGVPAAVEKKWADPGDRSE